MIFGLLIWIYILNYINLFQIFLVWHSNFLSKPSINVNRSRKGNLSNLPNKKNCQPQSVQDGNYDVDNFWETIEHDISDEKTFDYLKSRLTERIGEVEDLLPLEEALTDETKNVNEKENIHKKRKNAKIILTSKYVENNQLTHQGENNVLAECDIFIYLGEVRVWF